MSPSFLRRAGTGRTGPAFGRTDEEGRSFRLPARLHGPNNKLMIRGGVMAP